MQLAEKQVVQVDSKQPYSRPANKLYCAKKYQNRHFVLQAGIYIHLMRKKCTL